MAAIRDMSNGSFGRIPMQVAISTLVTALLIVAPVDAQQSTPPAELKVPSAYVKRLRTASPEIKSSVAALEARQKSEKWTFNVGYTGALDHKLSELTGARPEGPSVQILGARKAHADRALALYDQLRVKAKIPKLKVACNPGLKAYSWMAAGKVTSVKKQQPCGSCWAFASAAAFESSYLIENNLTADTSEQHLLNCTPLSDCGGGYLYNALDYLVVNGTATEAALGYTAVKGTCSPSLATPYDGVTWSPLDTDWQRIIPPNDMKQALCAHGPIATRMIVTPTFLAYTNGVYQQVEPVEYGGPGAHFVLIVGWDDSKSAWRIKNSWGPDWGEGGFAWIKWGANLIGHNSAWIQAAHKSLKLRNNPELMAIHKQYIPLPPVLQVPPTAPKAPSGTK
jgi:cathepsin L